MFATKDIAVCKTVHSLLVSYEIFCFIEPKILLQFLSVSASYQEISVSYKTCFFQAHSSDCFEFSGNAEGE